MKGSECRMSCLFISSNRRKMRISTTESWEEQREYKGGQSMTMQNLNKMVELDWILVVEKWVTEKKKKEKDFPILFFLKNSMITESETVQLGNVFDNCAISHFTGEECRACNTYAGGGDGSKDVCISIQFLANGLSVAKLSLKCRSISARSFCIVSICCSKIRRSSLPVEPWAAAGKVGIWLNTPSTYSPIFSGPHIGIGASPGGKGPVGNWADVLLP